MSSAQGRFTGPDSPLIDQYPNDPQSWNLYGYARNNPLSNIDPTGQDCIYTNNVASGGTVGVELGGCSNFGGFYVDGTIDQSTFRYDQRSGRLDYGYTGYSGGIYSVSTQLGPALDPGLNGFAALKLAGDRAAQGVTTSATLMGIFAGAMVGTYAAPAILAAATAAGGETGAVGAGVGLLKLAQKYGLNANSAKARQLLQNLDMSVEEFVGKYRLGSVKNAEGWKFDGMTVRQALDAGGKKLLMDGRFDKTK